MANNLRIVPLGGLGEVGKNMMCVEYGRNVVVVDAGLMFPQSDMPGIDSIIPDWSYLREKRDLIRAVLITHGHQDHIGALSYFLREFKVPVYATRLTCGLIEVELQRRHMLADATLHCITSGDKIEIGPFVFEPYHVCHSIPDTVGYGITCPEGLVVHSGDFKFDHTPVDGKPTDMAKLADFSQRGVLALLSDSTNSDQPGITPSEAVLYDAFRQIMRQAPGRLIIATFASLVSRVQQVVDVAHEQGRKIAIAGRSMLDVAKMATELGYLRIPAGMQIPVEAVNKLPPHEVVIMATGAQGEPMAVLNRLATGRHPSLRIQEKDTVVLSSHTIPGNEEVIHGVINRLFQRGADVYYHPIAQLHVSGHAGQEEQKQLINLLRPRHFVPIHGELRHLKQHGKIAMAMGIPESRVAVVENGHPLVFDKEHMSIGRRIPGGYVFIDGTQVGEIGPSVLAEREALGRSGFVTAVVRYSRRTGELLDEPHLVTRGFVPGADQSNLMERALDVTRSAAWVKAGTPAEEVREGVAQALSRFFYRETRRKPVVTAVVFDD